MTEAVRDCVFCGVIRNKPSEHLRTSDSAVLINDRSPHAPHHYLVLSRRHINKASDLTPADLPLLREMNELGRTYLREALKEKGEADTVEDLLRMGFHWSKMVTVRHLHLHVLYPVSQVRFFYRMVVFRPGMFFHTLKNVTDSLEREKNDGKTDVEVEREINPPLVNPESHDGARRLSTATGLPC